MNLQTLTGFNRRLPILLGVSNVEVPIESDEFEHVFLFVQLQGHVQLPFNPWIPNLLRQVFSNSIESDPNELIAMNNYSFLPSNDNSLLRRPRLRRSEQITGISEQFAGVTHTDDLNYLIPTLNVKLKDLMLHNTEDDVTMINIMTELWANFASTGYKMKLRNTRSIALFMLYIKILRYISTSSRGIK